MGTLRGKFSIQRAAFAGLLLCAFVGLTFSQGRNPVIFIPGLTGSELRNPQTKERIWFSAFKSDSGRIALPLDADPLAMHDGLVATDAIRSIKVGFIKFDVYGGFVKALANRAGYHEENWDRPSSRGTDRGVYVFAYDWRKDNVANARLLIRKVEDLRKKLGRPDLKFDIVAHSMGGLVSRYAAMYGDADLPPAGRKPRPTWSGAQYFNKIVLIGTPNEGAMNSFSAFVNGFQYRGLRFDLPFFQDTSKFMVFSIPAAYQLLPAPGAVRAFDDRLKPIDIDLYSRQTWIKYGWDITQDPDFVEHFTAAERRVADSYFTAALDRAKRLHEALAAADGSNRGVGIFAVGGDCRRSTPDGFVLYRDRSGAWKTQFEDEGFTRADGTRVSDAAVRSVVFSPGDGIVAYHSVNAALQSKNAGVASILGDNPVKKVCEDHNTQATSRGIQDHVIQILTGISVAPKQLATARQ